MISFNNIVAPFTGAWIEISPVYSIKSISVAPFTGAWIEISTASLQIFGTCLVAPFTGAWIEIKEVNNV